MGIFKKGAKETIEATGGLAEKIGNAFDKNFTSKEEKMQLRNELVQQALDQETRLVQMDNERFQLEASGNKLQRSWRPVTILTFVGIIVCAWVIFPIINIFVHSTDLAAVTADLRTNENFWKVVLWGVGGMGIMRTGEKLVKNNNIQIGRKKDANTD